MKINVERSDVKEWLEILGKANNKGISRRIYELMAVPTRRRAAINIYKLNKFTKEGDNVVVPGKVLSVGSIDHRVNISALEFSKEAYNKLRSANCNIVKIEKMINEKKVSVLI